MIGMKQKPLGRAPNFSAHDQNGKIHTLSEYKGKWLLLYFYPKDNTPGCIKEACEFRDHYRELQKRVEIVGVSGQSQNSHANFASKFNLPFPLLADPEKKIIKAYGTDGIILAKRTTFLIDPKGNIAKIYPKVDPKVHARDILRDLNTNML